MQVSYGKLTVNDGKEMGERWLPLLCDVGDGCLAPEARHHTIGRGHMALHGQKLHISAAGRNFFTLWPAYKLFPQLLGKDFVVNFATYTRVYVLYRFLLTS